MSNGNCGHDDQDHELMLAQMSAAVAEAFTDAAQLLIDRAEEKPRNTAGEFIFALVIQRLIIEGVDTKSRKALLGLVPTLVGVIDSVMNDINKRYSTSVVQEALARAQKETR